MNFPSVPIGELATINPPAPRGLMASNEEVAVVPMASVSEEGIVEVKEHKPANQISSGLSYFAQGDVLVAKITPCFENNKIALAVVDRPHAFGSTEFHVLRVDGGRLDRRYLTHFLRQDSVRQHGARRMTGSAGQRRVPAAFLTGLAIPLPPLEEQRRVAAILDHANSLRRKRSESLRLATQLKFSQLAALLDGTNPTREAPLGELVDEFRYGTSVKADGQGSPVLRIPNVIGDDIDLTDLKSVTLSGGETQRLHLRASDLLFVRTNGNPNFVGRSALVTSRLGSELRLAPRDFVFASYLIRARPRLDAVDPVYLQAYLASADGRRAALARAKTSAGQFNINIRGLSDIPVRLPSRSVQETYAAFLAGVEKEAGALRSSLARLGTLFEALRRRAFSGDLAQSGRPETV